MNKVGKPDHTWTQEEQFTQLFRQYAGRIFHYFKLHVKREDLAEDLTQELFGNIWKGKDRLFFEGEPNETIDAYLFVSARNLLYNHLEKSLTEKRRVLRLNQHQASKSPAYHHIEERLTEKETQAEFNVILNSLPPQRKKAFELSRQYDLSYEEIAREMGIAPRTVEKHLSAALKTIREKMATLITLFIIW